MANKKQIKTYRDKKGEEWKQIDWIKGGEEYYISNYGRFRKGEKLRRICIDDSGYCRCNIGKNKYRVHRLVAQAFIPNPDNLPVVDHIDNNKSNNVVSNLRWCTQQQNSQYAKDDGLGMNRIRTLVLAIDKDNNGTLYSSLSEASKDTGVDHQSVNVVASGKEKSRGGYRFIRLNEIVDKRYVYGKKDPKIIRL